jgi:hypothetical protein
MDGHMDIKGHVSGHFSLSRRPSRAVRTDSPSATHKHNVPLLGYRIV